MLARHAGARRFAFNQCLRLVHDALDTKRRDPNLKVPWSGFALINAFNAWKRSEAAGRTFAVGRDGRAELIHTGLAWRGQVSAGVFEEAAVDLGRAFSAYWASRAGRRPGPRVGFPHFKRKSRARPTFRVRNRLSQGGRPCVRVGEGYPRSLVLPVIGEVRVREDTRRLRRLLRPGPDGTARARIWFVTVTKHRDRWRASVTLDAPALHPARRHSQQVSKGSGFVGVDVGLHALVVAARADRTEVARIAPSRPLARGLPRLRRASRAASRTRPGSQNRRQAYRRLARVHGHIAAQRNHHLHEVSSSLVKTHDRLCLEDLATANLIRNRHLARSIADAGWGELRRQLRYKAAWYGTELLVAPRFFASTRTCSACGACKEAMDLAERTYRCARCGLEADRDLNAAANLAAWAERNHDHDAQAPDPQAGGRVNNAPGGTGSGRRQRDGTPGPATPLSPGGKKGEPSGATHTAT